MALGSHANVYNTCLLILRDRGFKMHVQGERNSAGSYPTDVLWIAEKDGFRLMADNPIELLGLVGIHDHVQPSADLPYWWRKEGEDVWERLMSDAFPGQDAGPA